MVIAHDLRVSVRTVQRWRKAWFLDGRRALASKGPASLPLLSDEQFAVLEQALAKGAVAHGWPDQTWTLSRIKTLIGRRFHKSYTVQGVAVLLKRHGWSCQVPARRAVERDDGAVAGWVKETWPGVEGPWRRSGARNNSRGVLMGCHLRQHKWQKLKMIVIRERWRQLTRELFPNATMALATLGGIVAVTSGVAATLQPLFGAGW